MGKYGGITIGPILDTFDLVSKPAELWGASYLFSFLASNLCEKLLLKYGKEIEILVPSVELDDTGKWYTKTVGASLNVSDTMEEGVGIFPDRIIWEIKNNKTEEENLKEISEIILKAKEDITKALIPSTYSTKKEMKEYIEAYLQVQAICTEITGAEGKNVLLLMSDYLDALELQKQIIHREDKNYILSLLENKNIKNTGIFPKNEEFSLMKKVLEDNKEIKRIRTLEEICQVERSNYKTENYFAIVQADGDNMGAALKQMMHNNEIQNFSRMCIQMAVTAHQIVKQYGGYMIYAGGDDLLFLMPLLSKDCTKSFFQLLKELSENFKKIAETELSDLKSRITTPTLSFGVAIQFKKSPLYEAFQEGLTMLFNRAKKEKDTLAISLQKHSGQSLEVVLKNFSNLSYRPELEVFFKDEVDQKLMRSVYHLLQLNKTTLQIAFRNRNQRQMEELFANIFDNDGQTKGLDYINKVKNLAISLQKDEKFGMDWENFLNFLKLVQFYYEKGEK